MTANQPVVTSRVVARPRAAIIAALVPDKFHHTITPGFSDGGRYSRIQEAIELLGDGATNPGQIGTTATIRVFTELVKLPDGTTGPMPFGADCTIAVTFNGALVASQAVRSADAHADVPVDLTKLNEGWYLVSATGLPVGWGVLDYWMYVRKGPKAIPQATMPVLTESHEHTFNGNVLSSALVPAVYKPTPMLVPPRDTPPFSGVPTADQIAYTMLSPLREGAMRRPSYLRSGVMTTFNLEAYYYASMQAKLPQWHLLDGPCGIGTITCPTSIRETGRPNSAKCTGTDPWRVWTRGHDGAIRTVAGYVHDEPLPYVNLTSGSQDYPGVLPRLVGDWSAIPADRRGFHELWDLAWDPDTLPIDRTQPFVNGEPPHIGIGPVAYVTDTQNGRVCKIQCNGGGPAGVALFGTNDRNAPAKVTEFVTGLSRPWGCEVVGSTLYVTQQGGGTITAYDKTTAAVQSSVALPGAEGCRYQDGILYVGSAATRMLWKLDVATKTLSSHATVPVGYYINVAVSDGSFFPRGYTATVTWLDVQFGFPMVWDTSGKEVNRYTLGFIPPSQGGKPMKGMPFPNGISYPTSVSLGDGRMTWGAVQEGLHRISASLASDTFPDPLVAKGEQEWKAKHYELLYEPRGFGFFGLPLPWGESPAIDAYLKQYGHAPAAIQPSTGTGSPMFKTVTKTSGTSALPVNTPNQPLVISLHGSGGGWVIYPTDPNYGKSFAETSGQGDRYHAVCGLDLGAIDSSDFEFVVTNYASIPTATKLAPVDRILTPVGTFAEQNHAGNKRGPDSPKRFHADAEARMDVMMEWAKANLPNIDWLRVGCTGNSMGGWGSFGWGVRRPQYFASVICYQPRPRNQPPQGTILDWESGVSEYVQAAQLMDDGSSFTAHYDLPAYVANPANKLPFIAHVISTADHFTLFQNTKDLLAAWRARVRDPSASNVIRTGYGLGWGPGDHAAGPGSVVGTALLSVGPYFGGTYDPLNFKLGAGYPVFDRSSLDGDPNDLVTWPTGYINRGFKWRNVVETATGWTCEISNTLGACDVDVYPHSEIYAVQVSAPQRVSIAAGQWVAVSFPAAVVVAPPAQPTISNVSVTPVAVALGATVQINATVVNAIALTLNGQPVALPVTLTPSAPSDTFTLVATGAQGTTPAQVVIGHPGWSA